MKVVAAMPRPEKAKPISTAADRASGDHQDGQIGRLRPARPHGGKSLVTWRVQEGDFAWLVLVTDLDLVRADVLSDAASFARGDPSLSHRIQ